MHVHQNSTAGLLLSLASTIPSSPLSRQAKRLASKISRPHDRQLDDKAALILSRLLTATDCEDFAGYSTEGVIDPAFDD
jgi:hypothetical protein